MANSQCRWCSAINCKNSSIKRPDLTFHRFPIDIERCKQWVINTRRADLDKKPAHLLYKNNVLCSEHFEACCFRESRGKRRLLTKDAVPTLFNIPNPPPKLMSTRAPPKEHHVSIFNPNTEAKFTPPGPCTTNGKSFEAANLEEQPALQSVQETEAASISKKKALKRKLKTSQMRNWRLQKKVQNMSRPGTSSELTIPKNLNDVLRQHLPEPSVSFVLTQIRVSKLSKNARRWTPAEKSFALSLYHASRKAYTLLQKIFHLPSPQTLSKSLRNINVQTGICNNILNLFQIKVQAMNTQERQCAVLFDEMSIKKGLCYDSIHDSVEGFEDYGLLGRSKKPADHALVFMVRGLSTRWKQPLSYVLTSGPVKASLIKSLLEDVLNKILQIGLKPVVIICDQGSNNRAMINSLGITLEKPFFSLTGNKIFVMYNPPHLIKSIRNNMKGHGYIVGGQPVTWHYIQKFYHMDSALPIRMAPKLTKRHLNLPVFSNLRVSLATQVLSHSVAAGLTTMVSLGALSPEASATAQFAEMFDRLFNAFNSRSLKSKRTMSNPESAKTDHVTFLRQTQKWLSTVKCNNKSGSLPCIEGWKLSVECLIQLWDHLRENCGFKFLLTSRLNQDCLENLFSVIRGKCGHRFNPTPKEFRIALRQTMVDRVLITSSKKNCKDDVDHFLFSFENVSSQGSRATLKSRLQRDVPPKLHQIMSSTSEKPALLLTEANILNYIGGYVALKLEAMVCPECKRALIQDKSTNDESHIFIMEKSFDSCKKGGLLTPSATLQAVLAVAETTFRYNAPLSLHISGLRSQLVRKIMEATSNITMTCPSSDIICDTRFLAVNLFVNIRLHYLVNSMNKDFTAQVSQTSTNRKAIAFKHM